MDEEELNKTIYLSIYLNKEQIEAFRQISKDIKDLEEKKDGN